MSLHPDVASFLASAHAQLQEEVMDFPHVLVAIDPESPLTPVSAEGLFPGAMAAMERAVTWAEELNNGGPHLPPADPPFLVLVVPLVGGSHRETVTDPGYTYTTNPTPPEASP